MVAIHVHLREHHTRHQPSSQAEQEEDKIAIRGFDNESGEIRLVREWRRGFDEPCGLFCACSPRTHETRPHADPGDATLLTLASLCVEINARRSEPWEMPATISEVVKKLNGVGVVSVKDLRQALTAPVSDGSVPARGSAAGFHLNSTLRTSGHRAFGEETLEIMRRLLGWVQVGRITSHRTESGRVASRRVASTRLNSSLTRLTRDKKDAKTRNYKCSLTARLAQPLPQALGVNQKTRKTLSNLLTSPLLLQLLHQPVQALVQPLSRRPDRALDVPVARAELWQVERVGDLCRRQRVWQVLLVCKDEELGVGELVVC